VGEQQPRRLGRPYLFAHPVESKETSLYAQGRPSNDVLRSPARGTATVSSIWNTYHGGAVGGVVSVLFTLDRRLFFKHDDGTIRLALDWERDEVFLQMLSWRDSAALQ
jgi:hypothetical protein